MITVAPNLWLVLICGIVSMVVGALWYAPFLFGRAWTSLTGRSAESSSKGEMGRTYLIMFVASLVTAYVLAHFTVYAAATTVSEALQVGLWVWLGFVATEMAARMAFTGQKFKLWLIDAGYQLVVLLIMSVILVLWS